MGIVDPLGYDLKLAKEGPEYETMEMAGLPVVLVLKPDPGHEYGGNYTYGWKVTIGAHQYGDFMGHLDTREQAKEAKITLLEQCGLTIEAIRKKEAEHGTDETKRPE